MPTPSMASTLPMETFHHKNSIFLLRRVHVVQLLAVLLGDHLKSSRLHVVNPHYSTRSCIPVGGVVDGPPAQVIGFLVSQVIPVASIQHSIGKNRARPNTEQIATSPLSITVHIVQSWPSLVIPSHHHAHRQTHPLIVVSHIGQQLAGGRHADPLPVTQLIQPALLRQPPLPVGAVRRPTGHGAQQVSVDLNDLLDTARPDIHPPSSPAVHGQQHATLVLEPKRGGAVGKVHGDIFALVIS